MVQAVLTSLYTYWTSIFLIPKGVLRKIDSICRNYLWDGSCIYVRTPLVNWDQVCSPKKEGGLGLKNSFTWNTFLQWGSWYGGYIASPDSNGCWLADMRGYTVSSGYEWLRQKNQPVGWARLIWKSWMVPKHSFFCWLLLRKALNVKEKLFRHGVTVNDQCCICDNGKEDFNHLFQDCRYTKMVLESICLSMQISVPMGNGIIWIGRKNWPSYKKNVCTLAFMAMYYAIWQQRNNARSDGVLLKPATLTTQILRLMQAHARVKLNLKNYEQELNWINALVTV
ncbi:uncharacterized protein LOC141649156 [Silene latifolia]|uniref:uncharacterized protein LOC141649156 n=1 Tax=Silene latifolia TaxID=37657 RepID=UPI003D774888